MIQPHPSVFCFPCVVQTQFALTHSSGPPANCVWILSLTVTLGSRTPNQPCISWPFEPTFSAGPHAGIYQYLHGGPASPVCRVRTGRALTACRISRRDTGSRFRQVGGVRSLSTCGDVGDGPNRYDKPRQKPAHRTRGWLTQNARQGLCVRWMAHTARARSHSSSHRCLRTKRY